MDKMLTALTIIAGFLILCQWYVFVRVRDYLFERHAPVSRRIAYPVLGLIGACNLAVLVLISDSVLFPADTFRQKAASVAFFSYLGVVLLLCLFFLLLGLLRRALNLKDALLMSPASVREGSDLLRKCERGSVISPWKAAAHESAAGMKSEERPSECPANSETAEHSGIPRRDPVLTRRKFFKWSTAVGIVTVGGICMEAVSEAFQPPVVEEFDLFNPHLQGLRDPVSLIHITDFHFGMFLNSDDLEILVKTVNSLPGDAVIITGDVFHSPMTPVEAAVPVLSGLKERRLGNFAVMGNHDFYAGERRSVEALRNSKLTLLRNRWITFREGDAVIHLGGIDDPMVNWAWGGEFPRFPRFMADAPGTPGMRIVLSHRPSVLPVAAQHAIDFVLSGHIHGGQIILSPGRPELGVSLARLVSPFTHGWYRRGDSHMYLNRGIGLTFVPWRINCPAEIAVFHLRPDGERNGPVRRSSARIPSGSLNCPTVMGRITHRGT
jgi:uncharacterized protein